MTPCRKAPSRRQVSGGRVPMARGSVEGSPRKARGEVWAGWPGREGAAARGDRAGRRGAGLVGGRGEAPSPPPPKRPRPRMGPLGPPPQWPAICRPCLWVQPVRSHRSPGRSWGACRPQSAASGPLLVEQAYSLYGFALWVSCGFWPGGRKAEKIEILFGNN